MKISGAFEVFDSGGSSRIEFAFITALSAQSGTHKPDQVYVVTRVIERGPIEELVRFRGVVLELATLQHFNSPHEYLPKQPHAVGRLQQYSSDRYAAHLLDLPGLAQEGLEPRMVAIHPLIYEDISPSRVRICGIDHGATDLVCTPESGPEGNSERTEGHLPEHQQEQHPSNVHQAAIPDVGIDFLEQLEEVQPPPKKAKKSTAKPHVHQGDPISESDSTDVTKGDSILDDPALRAFLSEDDISALLQAQDICKHASTAACFDDLKATTFEGNDSDESDGHSVTIY